MALNDAQIDQLEDLLFSEEMAEEALDYFGFHGLVCASVVGPSRIKTSTLANLALGNDSDQITNENSSLFNECIQLIEDDITSHLLDGRDIVLPHEKESEFEACLESWCIGFMEGFFHEEKAWFLQDESITAELLLPIMALSGLFDSEEFEAIEQNEKLMTQFASIVGDQLTDIYLYYHAN